MVQQAPPKKSGPGIGTALAIGTHQYCHCLELQFDVCAKGGAGLLGGAVLEDLWQDHDQNEREEGFQDGTLQHHWLTAAS